MKVIVLCWIFLAMMPPSCLSRTVKKNTKLGMMTAGILISNPDLQGLLMGASSLSSLSWAKITEMFRKIVAKIRTLYEDLEELHWLVEEHGQIALASIITIASCLFLAIIIIYKN